MRQRPTAMLLAAFLLVPPQIASPWGDVGHQLIGDIAEAALANDPNVMAQLEQVFGSGFHLRDIAPCADKIREYVREHGKQAFDSTCQPFVLKFAQLTTLAKRYPNSGPWHYINVPVDGHTHNLGDIQSLCGKAGCAPLEIQRYTGLLFSNAPLPARAEAILFLTHFIGDVHQPLHSAERNKDAGANLLDVIFFGRHFNLHHVWDDEIIPRIDTNGLTAGLPEPGDPLNPWQWALDSNQLAASVAYMDGGQSIPDVRVPPGAPLDSASYLAAAGPIVRQELRLAGVRLAAVLRQKLSQ